MYLRVTRGQNDPGKSDEVKQAVPAVVAAIKALPGCQGVQTGMDETGRTIAVSTFDTREHASFSRDVLGESLQRLTALGYTAQAPEIYEVI
jgi:quinol monooxygenase YgiN